MCFYYMNPFISFVHRYYPVFLVMTVIPEFAEYSQLPSLICGPVYYGSVVVKTVACFCHDVMC